MAIDWDAEVLSATMELFGEDQASRYMPAGAAAFDLADAVFDAEYKDIQLEGDMSDATQSRPLLGVRLSLFPNPPKQGDRVLVRSVNTVFMVANPIPDGHGHAKLPLQIAKDQSVQ